MGVRRPFFYDNGPYNWGAVCIERRKHGFERRRVRRLTRLPTKPQRIMAIAFIMVLCLLVYKVAELCLRQRLVAMGQTVPDQVSKPTTRPTMRWLFQCFEGLDLHHTLRADGTWEREILRLTDLHRQILRLLGPAYEHCYLVAGESAQ
jgi:hypothetical protein